MLPYTGDGSRHDGPAPRIRAAAKILVIERIGRVLLIRFRDRDVARRKLKALGEGAEIVRNELSA